MATESGWRELGPPRRPRTGAISGFTRLARTHALAMAGDALVTLALAGSLFFSISPTAARGRVILSLVLTMAPFAVVAPFLGPLIDRSRAGRRFMIVATAIGRAVACVFMARVLDGLLLFPAAFTVLVLSKAYSVSKSAVVPAVVDDEELLVRANSKLVVAGVAAGFVASVPGVLLLRFAGGEWTLALASIVFVTTAVAALALPSTPAPVVFDDHTEVAGPAATRAPRQHTIEAAAVATALLRAMVGFLTFLIAFGFRRIDAPSWQFGVVLAASMAANLCGAALAPVVRGRLREEWMLVAALGTVGIAGLTIARLDGVLWAALVAAAVGISAAAGKLSFDALVQRDAHESDRGRSFARFEAGFQLVWVVGALLPVIVATPLRQGFDVLGIAGVAGAAAYTFAYRRLGKAEA
ncbi:MAG TPA: MFS transporter [Acidimicrobiales bacterium]|nr:MFS transporter [Acidimicrobiales bacterium]